MKITDIRTLSLSRPHEPELQWYSATFHVPKADCSICIIETDEGLAGHRRALRVRRTTRNRRSHRRTQTRPHRPRPPRRRPDAAQQRRARQRHRQRRPQLCAVGSARQDRWQTHRRPALRGRTGTPAPPPPLRFLGRVLRLGRPPRIRRRRGHRLCRRGFHRLQDAYRHPLGLVGRHRRSLPENSAPSPRGRGCAYGLSPRRQLPPLDGGGTAHRRGTRRDGLGLV